MKKLLAMIISGVIVCGTFAGCGENEDTDQQGGSTETEKSETTNLTFAWWGNQTRNEMTQEVIDLYMSQNEGIQIDGQFAEFNDYWNKLATSSAGHTLPDIIQMDYGYIEQYANNDLLVDLTPYIEDGTLDVSNIDEKNLNVGKVGDGIYGICLTVAPPALTYNKTLLDENGITVKNNMSMEEFYDVCREVYEKTGYKTNISYGSDVYLTYLLRANGEVLYEKGKLGVKSPESLEKYFEIYELGREEGWLIDPGVFAERTLGSMEQDAMVYGTSPETMSWCSFIWANQLSAIQNAAPEGMELDMVTYPSPDVVKSNFLKPSQLFCVTVDSKNPEESVKFIDFLINSVECNEIILCERGIQTNTKMAAEIIPKLSDSDKKAIEFTNNVVIPASSQVNPAPPEGSSEVSSLIGKTIERVCYQEINAKEAAQEIFEQGNEIMAAK